MAKFEALSPCPPDPTTTCPLVKAAPDVVQVAHPIAGVEPPLEVTGAVPVTEVTPPPPPAVVWQVPSGKHTEVPGPITWRVEVTWIRGAEKSRLLSNIEELAGEAAAARV